MFFVCKILWKYTTNKLDTGTVNITMNQHSISFMYDQNKNIMPNKFMGP